MYMFIIRHGETEWNRLQLVQGISDNPLNNKGIEQAKEIAPLFKEMLFDAVITSPLIRTKQTARYVCKYAKVKSWKEDVRIIEKNFGICEGIPISQRYDQYPNGHAEGEESFQTVRKRMLQAISSYANDYDGNILISTHGCAIAALLKELDPIYEKQFVRLKNTSITIVDKNLKLQGFDMDVIEVKKWMSNHSKYGKKFQYVL